MSAENFFSKNPPTTETARQIRKEQANKKNLGSPMEYLAGELIKSASAGIRNKSDSAVSIFGQTQEAVNETSRNSLNDIAALWWGSLVFELEKVRKDGIFSTQDVIGCVNFNLTGTILPRYELDKSIPTDVSLPDLEWGKICRVHEKDPTWSEIINDLDLIPGLTWGLSNIKGLLIPTLKKWKPLADIYLAVHSQELQRKPVAHIPSVEEMVEMGFSEEQLGIFAKLVEKHL